MPLLPSPFVPPVILPGGYLIEDFTNQFSALKPLYTATAISITAVALRHASGKRNGTQEKIHNVLRQYHSRSRIPTKLLPSSANFKTLPRLSQFPVPSSPFPVPRSHLRGQPARQQRGHHHPPRRLTSAARRGTENPGPRDVPRDPLARDIC